MALSIHSPYVNIASERCVIKSNFSTAENKGSE